MTTIERTKGTKRIIYNGKKFHEMKPAERAELKRTEPTLYEEMHAEPPKASWEDKCHFEDLTPYEKADMKRRYPELYELARSMPSAFSRLSASEAAKLKRDNPELYEQARANPDAGLVPMERQ